MYSHTEDILEIYKETELKRIVKIEALISTYGGRKRETKAFLKRDWPRIKHQGHYRDREAVSSIDYFENLTEDEWQERYHKVNIEDFSDEEIVREFNRRLGNVFHKIGLEAKAKIKEN